MAYKLLYTKSAAKDIQKLDTVVRKRLKSKLETYAKNPLFYAKKLTDSSLGTYRWRIGNYRIIFDIDINTIVILRVRHRREIYRN
ncbi:MAG: type II toxin-antitoxin system RelE/ParE family toxin [Candidatus Levybacteria bacterium]|nr:type II toxin-antitoxin system RelE/ParE family toxin [Candidatus Levybacteria bacterium]MDZ4227911.1 type II toxin-antitoxin system RelE/ParE family toxin [Candidatus Levybacteria bacterium]